MSSANVKVCDIEDDVKDALKKFRFRKHDKNSALILKVDREKHLIFVDEEINDISLDDLQESLPSHQPRFIVYSYRMEHADGRISFPMCFIFYTPRDSQMALQMMYAGTKLALQREAELTRSYEIREIEELTEEWLKEKIGQLICVIRFVVLLITIQSHLIRSFGETILWSFRMEVMLLNFIDHLYVRIDSTNIFDI